MHIFPSHIIFDIPERFNNPFRYAPHPYVKAAAEIVMEMMKDHNPRGEGKMLGVLIVKDRKGDIGFIAGFSGNIGGKSIIEGFVPPIFDLLDPNGDFKKEEAEISHLNKRISDLEESPELLSLHDLISGTRQKMEQELAAMKDEMARNKAERAIIRSGCTDPSVLASLIKDSQFEKAEFRRRKTFWENILHENEAEYERLNAEIVNLRKERASRSDILQRWIFDRYIVMNANGEEASISDIFSRKGLTAPGGTGECAAPKLLDYAFRNGFTPLAMGEFWYGKPSETAVRTHGNFYPSCTSKCGPLLEYMLEGLDYDKDPDTPHGSPAVIFEDEDITVVSKPSGMPSVPGLDGRTSLLEWLKNSYSGYLPVHRLDMDTSGIMLFAKNLQSSARLQEQFEMHSIRKTYMARLSPSDKAMKEGSRGIIECPLCPDYDERPRQKVDHIQGKPSLTEYQVTGNNSDMTSDIVFRPLTGRTHQLRVHSAHVSGLGRPIVGDLLYGGAEASRLMLHAYSISFIHPTSHEELTFETLENIYTA